MNLCNRTNLSTWENIAKQVPSIKVENGMYISKDNVLIGYEGKSEKLVVPEGITTIANNVIKGEGYNPDSKIAKEIVIPDTVKVIEDRAFFSRYNLEKVTLPKNLTEIGDYAFFECKALKEIKLPEGLQSIGVGVFYRTGIKQLTIPGSVVKIDVIDKSIKLSKPSYLKKFKRDSGAIYYEARATIKASGKKAVTYKASRITKIKAKTSKVTIQKGKTTKLQTRVYISKKLKKGYLDPEILKFTTSNKKVVKVSSKGTIKGLKKGKATVTVKLRTTGKTYKVNVKVK